VRGAPRVLCSPTLRPHCLRLLPPVCVPSCRRPLSLGDPGLPSDNGRRGDGRPTGGRRCSSEALEWDSTEREERLAAVEGGGRTARGGGIGGLSIILSFIQSLFFLSYFLISFVSSLHRIFDLTAFGPFFFLSSFNHGDNGFGTVEAVKMLMYIHRSHD